MPVANAAACITDVERLQMGRRSPAMVGGVFSAALEDTTRNFQKTLLMRLQAAGAVA